MKYIEYEIGMDVVGLRDKVQTEVWNRVSNKVWNRVDIYILDKTKSEVWFPIGNRIVYDSWMKVSWMVIK